MLPLMVVLHEFENKYYEKYRTRMDEMKMQKLLYFAQKESYAVLDRPLFTEDFHGWRYGPVLHEVRDYYDRIGDKPVNLPHNDLLAGDEYPDYA